MTDADHDDDTSVQRYEQLRAQALDGGPGGFKLGLALLERRGVVAWAHAWRNAAPAREPHDPAVSVAWPPSASSELVGVLAGMALARVTAG